MGVKDGQFWKMCNFLKTTTFSKNLIPFLFLDGFSQFLEWRFPNKFSIHIFRWHLFMFSRFGVIHRQSQKFCPKKVSIFEVMVRRTHVVFELGLHAVLFRKGPRLHGCESKSFEPCGWEIWTFKVWEFSVNLT